MSDVWKSSNARGYITFSFNLKELRNSLDKVKHIDKYDIRKNHVLYKNLLEILGECLNKYVPYDTGNLARFYTDSKNGLMYRRFNAKDGFNVAEYQYNVPTDHSHGAKRYVYPPSSKYPKGKVVTIPGKKVVHPEATDHWADKEHQSKIWPRFTQRAKPLIVKAIREELRGKK